MFTSNTDLSHSTSLSSISTVFVTTLPPRLARASSSSPSTFRAGLNLPSTAAVPFSRGNTGVGCSRTSRPRRVTAPAWRSISSRDRRKEVRLLCYLAKRETSTYRFPRSISQRLAEERSALILALSLLKRNAFASPFERGFRLQAEIEASPVEDGAADPRTEIMTLHYRPSEAIYLLPSSDRVTVIFSTIFKEETDRILGKIFLQEFVDARRRPSCQTAPQVLYSNREPPLEIRHLQGLETTERVGYVTFGAIFLSCPSVLFFRPLPFPLPPFAPTTSPRYTLSPTYLARTPASFSPFSPSTID